MMNLEERVKKLEESNKMVWEDITNLIKRVRELESRTK